MNRMRTLLLLPLLSLAGCLPPPASVYVDGEDGPDRGVRFVYSAGDHFHVVETYDLPGLTEHLATASIVRAKVRGDEGVALEGPSIHVATLAGTIPELHVAGDGHLPLPEAERITLYEPTPISVQRDRALSVFLLTAGACALAASGDSDGYDWNLAGWGAGVGAVLGSLQFFDREREQEKIVLRVDSWH